MACRASLARHKIKVCLTTGDTLELTDRQVRASEMGKGDRAVCPVDEKREDRRGRNREVTVVTGVESLGMTPKVSKQLWINKSIRASGREERREGVERRRGSFLE